MPLSYIGDILILLDCHKERIYEMPEICLHKLVQLRISIFSYLIRTEFEEILSWV